MSGHAVRPWMFDLDDMEIRCRDGGIAALKYQMSAIHDGRLIAAAPDLLEALQTLVSQRDAHFHTAAAWDAARTAIAKANGDAP